MAVAAAAASCGGGTAAAVIVASGRAVVPRLERTTRSSRDDRRCPWLRSKRRGAVACGAVGWKGVCIELARWGTGRVNEPSRRPSSAHTERTNERTKTNACCVRSKMSNLLTKGTRTRGGGGHPAAASGSPGCCETAGCLLLPPLASLFLPVARLLELADGGEHGVEAIVARLVGALHHSAQLLRCLTFGHCDHTNRCGGIAASHRTNRGRQEGDEAKMSGISSLPHGEKKKKKSKWERATKVPAPRGGARKGAERRVWYGEETPTNGRQRLNAVDTNNNNLMHQKTTPSE